MNDDVECQLQLVDAITITPGNMFRTIHSNEWFVRLTPSAADMLHLVTVECIYGVSMAGNAIKVAPDTRVFIKY